MIWMKQVILNAATICNIAPADIESIIRVESNYCKYTKSSVSTARGCGQLLVINRNVFDDKDLRHPEQTIYAATVFMCNLKSRFPRSWKVRYHVGPNGDTNSEAAIVYKNKIDIKNNLIWRSL